MRRRNGGAAGSSVQGDMPPPSQKPAAVVRLDQGHLHIRQGLLQLCPMCSLLLLLVAFWAISITAEPARRPDDALRFPKRSSALLLHDDLGSARRQHLKRFITDGRVNVHRMRRRSLDFERERERKENESTPSSGPYTWGDSVPAANHELDPESERSDYDDSDTEDEDEEEEVWRSITPEDNMCGQDATWRGRTCDRLSTRQWQDHCVLVVYASQAERARGLGKKARLLTTAGHGQCPLGTACEDWVYRDTKESFVKCNAEDVPTPKRNPEIGKVYWEQTKKFVRVSGYLEMSKDLVRERTLSFYPFSLTIEVPMNMPSATINAMLVDRRTLRQVPSSSLTPFEGRYADMPRSVWGLAQRAPAWCSETGQAVWPKERERWWRPKSDYTLVGACHPTSYIGVLKGDRIAFAGGIDRPARPARQPGKGDGLGRPQDKDEVEQDPREAVLLWWWLDQDKSLLKNLRVIEVPH